MSLNYRKGVPRTVNSLARSALKVQGAVYVEGLRSETVLNGNAWELTRHAEHRVLLIPPPQVVHQDQPCNSAESNFERRPKTGMSDGKHCRMALI